jgi:nitric oxide dioxygenase
MTPEQVALVERSLAQAGPAMPGIVAGFYERLFAADPDLRSMFATDAGLQHARFAAGMETLTGSIRRHPDFLAEVAGLGRRHVAYGVRPAHYRTVGTAFLGALGAGLGDAWTDEVAEAWRLAYNLIAEAMMCAAAEADVAGCSPAALAPEPG